jgi:hypothetical protein
MFKKVAIEAITPEAIGAAGVCRAAKWPGLRRQATGWGVRRGRACGGARATGLESSGRGGG